MLTIDLYLFKQDTVIDAGKYDGSLGIISAISALKVLKISGRLGELKRPVEVCPLIYRIIELIYSFVANRDNKQETFVIIHFTQ